MIDTGADGADWSILDGGVVTRTLGVDPDTGLSDVEVRERLADAGPNELRSEERRNLAGLAIDQLRDPLIYLLGAAAVVSLVVDEPIDAVVILLIVVVNGVIGTFQGYRADQALAALRTMSAPHATVVRDGARMSVPSPQLVPGDIVLLSAGDRVTADMCLVECASLQVGEAALTGESMPVMKSSEPAADASGRPLPLADRTNMAFRGTDIVAGRARGAVVATGMRTEIGRIAEMVASAEGTQTPLQRRLGQLGTRIALAIIAISCIVFLAGLLRGEDPVQLLLTSVSLAVAAVPEALPAVVAITLATGASAMAARNALAKRLPAVETLGSVTHICTDKTGTLTQNRMSVADSWLAPGRTAEELNRVLVLCNDARPGTDEPGDPTEVALLEFAGDRPTGWTRIAEIPFDSERKRMSTVDRSSDALWLSVKGAPEQIISRCALTPGVQHETDRMARSGLRVLAAARRRLMTTPAPDAPEEELESDLELVGLVGLLDPPRPEAADAVAECSVAGIAPIMMTGDHPATAAAIAELVGIAHEPGGVVTSAELARTDDEALASRIDTTTVYARVDPAQKIRIVRELQGRGHVVAMTGDGVNDAPALKQADIGVAMGEGGTDVARGAADLILLDNNFATIVAAVGEGRRIYDNIRRFVRYVLTGNSGEIWTIFLAPFLGLPLPLLPLQILWINLLTDGLPGLALAQEPAEPDVMRRRPRPPRQSIFAGGLGAHIVWVGLLIGALSLIALAVGWNSGSPAWQTMVFTTLVFCQLVHCYAIRSERRSVFRTPIRANPSLIVALVATFALQLAVVYWRPLGDVFDTTALSLGQFALCVGLSLVVLVGVEIEKWMRRVRTTAAWDTVETGGSGAG